MTPVKLKIFGDIKLREEFINRITNISPVSGNSYAIYGPANSGSYKILKFNMPLSFIEFSGIAASSYLAMNEVGTYRNSRLRHYKNLTIIEFLAYFPTGIIDLFERISKIYNKLVFRLDIYASPKISLICKEGRISEAKKPKNKKYQAKNSGGTNE